MSTYGAIRPQSIKHVKELYSLFKFYQSFFLGIKLLSLVYSLRLRQDGRNFANNIFKSIISNENCCILIQISLKYVAKGPIDNNPVLFQITAGHRRGSNPSFEAMMA